MSLSKRLRYEILRRDNHTCRYCGSAAPDVTLEVDHVVPRSLGGDDEPSNLATACVDCNAGKTSSTADSELVEDVSQDALRWSAAIKEAGELQRRRSQEVSLEVDEFDYAWEWEWDPTHREAAYEPDKGWHYSSDPERKYPVVVWIYEDDEPTSGPLFDSIEEAEAWCDRKRERNIPPRPKDWRKVARSWIAAGLTSSDFQELVAEVVSDRDYINWDRKWAYTAGCCWGRIRERQAIAQALLAAEEQPSNGGA